MKRESALVGFGFVALGTLGVALALARCTDGERRPAQGPPASEPAAQSSDNVSTTETTEEAARPAGTAIAAPIASVDPEPNGAVASAAEPGKAPSTSTGGSFVSRALASAEPTDLELLGRIERELGREPPPEVHAMLRRRKQGASRDELVGMARALSDLRLRVLVLRWLDEVRPAPGSTNTGRRAPAVRAASSATPFLKRVEPVR